MVNWPFLDLQKSFLMLLEKSAKSMTIEDVDISDLESICPDTPEEISMQITRNKYWWEKQAALENFYWTVFSLGLKMNSKENEVVVLTTGGTFDKEYPRGLGGYAFEFGTITGAERIQKRTRSRFTVESICKLDSQGRRNSSQHWNFFKKRGKVKTWDDGVFTCPRFCLIIYVHNRKSFQETWLKQYKRYERYN